MTPTMHKPIPMNTRVVVPKHYINKENAKGTVIGIATKYVIFQYIVLLDSPIETEYGECRAIVVIGSELRGENGEDWLLTH